MRRFDFPDGKKFAFTFCDDTDMARVETVEPVYRLLESLGMKASKSVWPLRSNQPSIFAESQTLEDTEYRDFVVDLSRRGFEITMHGPSMVSSTRQQVADALELFFDTFGDYPRLHTNHETNRDNLYWGSDRLDHPVLRRLHRLDGLPDDHYQGHVENSPYWWGDLCSSKITYIRNLTFNEINLCRINPSMPYHDPGRPLVPFWFSATDADHAAVFNEMFTSERQERLEQEGGVCIVATHFGKRFVRNGRVDPVTQGLLEELASRRGWFPNVSELLDHLRFQRSSTTLPAGEWRRMQWAWARDVLKQKLDERGRRREHRKRKQVSAAALAESAR